MDAHDADVGHVHGAAHVEAAGQGDAHGGGQTMVLEVGEHGVHQSLHRAGGVGGGGVAVQPALRVDDVGDAGAGAADGELVGTGSELAGSQVFLEGLEGFKVGDHEFHVGTGGPANVTAAVLVGDFADFADVHGGHGTGAAAADGVHLVAAFGHMHEHAGFQDFVVQPLAEVLGNDLREEGVVLAGSDIGDTTFHGFCRIVTGRNKSHFCSPL